VFVTAALGNFAAYLSTNAASWHYDVNKVSWAAFIFYGYVAVIPLGLYFLLKYLGVVSGLVQLWCLYGYSLFVFIPASVSYSFSYFSIIYYFFLSVMAVVNVNHAMLGV